MRGMRPGKTHETRPHGDKNGDTIRLSCAVGIARETGRKPRQEASGRAEGGPGIRKGLPVAKNALRASLFLSVVCLVT
jgi:hypothetical protein